MKSGLKRIFLFSCLLLLFGAFTPKRVEAVQTGLVTEGGKTYLYINGQKVKDKMYSITQKDGKKYTYYFTKTGAACTTYTTYQDHIFCFDSKGRMRKQSGNKVKVYKAGKYYFSPTANGTCRQDTFVYAKKKLYYAKHNGRMVKNNTVYGVTFGSNCVAKSGISTTCKVTCINLLNQITNPNWSAEKKLRACWDYVTNANDFSYVLRYDPDLSSTTWMKKKCVEMLNSHGGDCVSFACAFAGLAAAIGYKPVVIYGRVPGTRDQAADGFTTHCWVTINYRYFDPEGQYDGWNKNCYDLEKYPFAFQVTHSYGFESGRIIQ
ncbi:MAG: hypothetical protein IIZ39_11935 [Blautia sp.]|nr:hypothetical protein [Blautia sp.]